MKHNTSIRITLFVVLAVLNSLIAAILGYGVYRSSQNYSNAQSLIEIAEVIAPLSMAQKFLAQERSWSIASIYSDTDKAIGYKDALAKSRDSADEHINTAFKRLRQNPVTDVTLSLSKVEDDYKKLKLARGEIDSYLALKTDKKSRNMPTISNDIVASSTDMVRDIQFLMNDYSQPFMAKNPAAARQLRFSAVVGEITEYASREYTVLAKLIAEDEYPSQELQEQMALWRGRINYGWDIVRSSATTNTWGETAKPSIENAENTYFSMFEKIREIFKPAGSQARSPDYPITVDAWLDLASGAVDALYEMNAVVMDIGLKYKQDVQKEAFWSIVFSLLLFVCTMCLSLYLWRMIALRVVRPLDIMVDSLYKTATGEQTVMPVFDHSPEEITKLSKVLGAMQSYSTQLQIERDNAKSADAAKTDFLANISHELRTPMNVVLGLSDIISRSEPLTAKQKEYLASLNLSAKSLLAIINDLLDFSQFETSSVQIERQPFDLPQLLNDVHSFMTIESREKGLHTELKTDQLVQNEYWGDSVRLRQILINLYGNAIKFTSKGYIRLDAFHGYIGPDKQIKCICIRLSDTGIGIPADQLERIFDRFTQVDASINRRYGGTGLGLAITKALVDMMGGDIVVESVVGIGSSFMVRIPLEPVLGHSEKDSEGTDNAPEGMFTMTHDKKILLVEDYAPNILVGTTYLEGLGYAYDVAENGETAFELVQNNRYMAILLDVQLPDMLGYEVTTAIRAYEESAGLEPTRIIGITAYALESDRAKCLAVGMDDYLAKPYTMEQLSQKIVRTYN